VEVASGAVRHREAIETLVRGTQGVRAVTNAIVIGQ
jgi:hypothetical protein